MARGSDHHHHHYHPPPTPDCVRLGLVGKSWRLERSGMNNTITRWGILSKSTPKKEGGGGDKVDFRRSSNELVHGQSCRVVARVI